MGYAVNDCSRICGTIIGKSILYGIPLSMLWQLMLILCAARIFHFIALER